MKQVIIDTNIFLRYFLRDMETQYQESSLLFTKISKEEVVGVVSVLVINEVIWGLGTRYKINRNDYLPKLKSIIALKNIRIAEVSKDVVQEIFNLMIGNKIDFTDYYLSKIAGDRDIFSFDKDFQKLLKS
jgi:predicted nucleic-acid-binding protein